MVHTHLERPKQLHHQNFTMGSCSPNAAETEALAFDELVQQLREREYPSLLSASDQMLEPTLTPPRDNVS